jgi:hypothetical protein
MDVSSTVVVLCFVALAIFLAKAYGSTTVLPEYPPAGTRRAFCTTCIDLRFVDTKITFLNNEFGIHSYDIFAAPGPSLALSDPADATDPQHAALPGYVSSFSNAWRSGLEISQAVNSTTQVALLDHENCGFFNLYNGYLDGDYATKKAIQFAQMSKTINYLKTATTLYPTVYYGYWVGLNGVTEAVPA